MSVRLLLVPVLLYSLAATAAEEPHPALERWGDLAPEYGYGECDAGLPHSEARSSKAASDSAREREPSPTPLSPSDAVPERRYGGR